MGGSLLTKAGHPTAVVVVRMGEPIRLLVTGSRSLTDRGIVVAALSDACWALKQGDRQIRLVHGAALGADLIAAQVWADWCNSWPHLFVEAEAHPADWKTHGKQAGAIRNVEMVKLGAALVVTFAHEWASGTGHCARLARKAGIEVLDILTPTSIHDRPHNIGRRAA